MVEEINAEVESEVTKLNILKPENSLIVVPAALTPVIFVSYPVECIIQELPKFLDTRSWYQENTAIVCDRVAGV